MRKLRITIDNKSYDVTVEDLTEAHPYQTPAAPATGVPASSSSASSSAAPATPATPSPPSPAPTASQPQLPVDPGAVTSPMAGSIKSVLVKTGEAVDQGRPLVVLEAMKMDNQITAPVAGKVKRVDVAVGESVQEGHILIVLE